MAAIKVAAMAALLPLLASCASERVVLLPSRDGRPSGVVVKNAKDGKEVLLEMPYAGVASGFSENRAFQTTPEEVQVRYGAALDAQPMRPTSYTLYFESGGNQLTTASEAEFAKVCREIADRPGAEAMVIGHTDRVGSIESNDKLSLRRAEMVRDQLIAAGVPAVKLELVGRGEREPLVPTADEIPEPRNRRVEINVR